MENTKKEIRQKFFEQFGESSFRGYPLEQCYLILEFFEPYLSSLPSTEERKTAEETREDIYSLLKRYSVGGMTIANALHELETVFNKYASQQTEAMAKEIEELKKEDAETDELCKKILNGKGTVYVRGLESQLSDAKKEIEGWKEELAFVQNKYWNELSAMREREKTPQLDPYTLDRIKFMFKLFSDHSTQCLGYKELCRTIESLNPTKQD